MCIGLNLGTRSAVIILGGLQGYKKCPVFDGHKKTRV